MGKSARLKKKYLKQQAIQSIDNTPCIEEVIASIPSFIVILRVLNDWLYGVISIEEKTNDDEKMLLIINKANAMIDNMMVEVNRRQDEYIKKEEEFKEKCKANPDDTVLSVEALKTLALDQMDNIKYLKNTFPLYNDEFCNLLSISHSEKGQQEFNSLKARIEEVTNNTIGLLSTFTVF